MDRIRQAGRQDIEALYGMVDALGFHKEEGYFERCLQEQDEGRRQVFIAHVDGADVGYGMLNWRPQYALYKRLNIPEIQDLNVIPVARRQGVASAIIEHCEALAHGKGCDHIGISVGLYADYGPAQRLYVKQGYLPDGYGVVTCDREPVAASEIRPVNALCLMMVKDLVSSL